MNQELSGFGRFAEPSLYILVSLSDGPKHGYAIMTDVEAFSGLAAGAGDAVRGPRPARAARADRGARTGRSAPPVSAHRRSARRRSKPSSTASPGSPGPVSSGSRVTPDDAACWRSTRARWRERYEDEFLALLDDATARSPTTGRHRPGRRSMLDCIRSVRGPRRRRSVPGPRRPADPWRVRPARRPSSAGCSGSLAIARRHQRPIVVRTGGKLSRWLGAALPLWFLAILLLLLGMVGGRGRTLPSSAHGLGTRPRSWRACRAPLGARPWMLPVGVVFSGALCWVDRLVGDSRDGEPGRWSVMVERTILLVGIVLSWSLVTGFGSASARSLHLSRSPVRRCSPPRRGLATRQRACFARDPSRVPAHQSGRREADVMRDPVRWPLRHGPSSRSPVRACARSASGQVDGPDPPDPAARVRSGPASASGSSRSSAGRLGFALVGRRARSRRRSRSAPSPTSSPPTRGCRSVTASPPMSPRPAPSSSWSIPAAVAGRPGVDPTGDGPRLNVRALSQRCPHLGCRPNPCIEDCWFRCPCHQSRYDRLGIKAAGRAVRTCAARDGPLRDRVDAHGVLIDRHRATSRSGRCRSPSASPASSRPRRERLLMTRPLSLTRLYPGAWRRRYGDEMTLLLEDRPPRRSRGSSRPRPWRPRRLARIRRCPRGCPVAAPWPVVALWTAVAAGVGLPAGPSGLARLPGRRLCPWRCWPSGSSLVASMGCALRIVDQRRGAAALAIGGGGPRLCRLDPRARGGHRGRVGRTDAGRRADPRARRHGSDRRPARSSRRRPDRHGVAGRCERDAHPVVHDLARLRRGLDGCRHRAGCRPRRRLPVALAPIVKRTLSAA